MGTGKTAVGKQLAKKKNKLENRGLASNSQSQWQFVDLDELIELKERRTICHIFAEDGEPYFRRLEKQVLKEVSKEKKFVIACGGGIVIDKDNLKIMKETGIIICLAATPEVILKRTSEYAHRPLLNVGGPKKQIELLLKLRAPYYTQADKTIDTSKKPIEQVVEYIIKVTKTPGHKVTPKIKKAKGKNKK